MMPKMNCSQYQAQECYYDDAVIDCPLLDASHIQWRWRRGWCWLIYDGCKVCSISDISSIGSIDAIGNVCNIDDICKANVFQGIVGH